METKPTAFKRGFPAEQANAFYGIEDEMIEMSPGDQIVTITTWSVDEVMEKHHAGQQWPVVGPLHIEVVDGAAADQAIALRNAAYKKRTGQDALAIVEGDE